MSKKKGHLISRHHRRQAITLSRTNALTYRYLHWLKIKWNLVTKATKLELTPIIYFSVLKFYTNNTNHKNFYFQLKVNFVQSSGLVEKKVNLFPRAVWNDVCEITLPYHETGLFLGSFWVCSEPVTQQCSKGIRGLKTQSEALGTIHKHSAAMLIGPWQLFYFICPSLRSGGVILQIQFWTTSSAQSTTDYAYAAWCGPAGDKIAQNNVLLSFPLADWSPMGLFIPIPGLLWVNSEGTLGMGLIQKEDTGIHTC